MNDVASVELIDARPFLPATADSPWTRAEGRRDALAKAIEDALAAHGVKPLILRSQPGVYPIGLTVSGWRPEHDRGGSIDLRRESVSISIGVNPYLEEPLSYGLAVETTRKVFKATPHHLPDAEAAKLAKFAFGFAGRPHCLPSVAAVFFERLVRFFIPFIHEPGTRLIASARPNRLTAPTLLSVAALLVLAIAAATDTLGLATLPVVGLLIAAMVIAGGRERPYCVVKRPEIAPRSLLLMDTWHTSVPSVGRHYADLVARIERAVRALDPDIIMAWETYHYRTPYGVEDRRRLTLTKGQAVVHIHLHPFADDVFVGWDGFLNRVCWAETVAVSTRVEKGRKVEFRSLTVSDYAPNDMDLVDLNALSELVHRRIVMEIKALLKEQEIEADIDFSIIRGQRDNALGGQEAPKSNRGGWRDLKAAKG